MAIHRKPAFSIIELLVVVVILGLLTTLAVTSYTAAQKTARDNARKGQVQSLANAVETYHLANRSFPGSNDPEDGAACSGLDGDFRYYYYHPDECAPPAVWIPGLDRFLSPFVVDKDYRGSRSDPSGAYQDMLRGGESRSYGYRNLNDSFVVYTRTENDESGMEPNQVVTLPRQNGGRETIIPSSDIFFVQK